MISASFQSDFQADADLDQLYLEIDPALREQIWQQSQTLATPASRWRAYLNGLALQTLLPWLREDSLQVRPMLARSLWPTLWEWGTGVAVDVESSVNNVDATVRWVLLVSEAIDADELRVPQEWIEIPAWVGDYYVLVQIEPDEGWLKIAGLATHEALKTKGRYDWRDRTYSLPASDLITDVNVISVAQALTPTAITRAAVAPLPELSVAQAQQLINRLSSADLLEPRLAIDFANWSALMAHGGWRQQMAQQRWGRSAAFGVKQWLQSGVAQMAQQLGWQSVSFQPAAMGARGEATGETESTAQTGLSRPVSIANETYVLQVLPLAASGENAWRFELRKLNGMVAPGIALRLLSEDLQPFENNEVRAIEPTEVLFLDVALAEGEGIVWQVEPQADQYEPEILKF
jgi:hypothetical protein